MKALLDLADGAAAIATDSIIVIAAFSGAEERRGEEKSR